MILFKTQIIESVPGLQKQLKIDIKSTAKFDFYFKYMNTCIFFFSNLKCFCCQFLFFLVVCKLTSIQQYYCCEIVF